MLWLIIVSIEEVGGGGVGLGGVIEVVNVISIEVVLENLLLFVSN